MQSKTTRVDSTTVCPHGPVDAERLRAGLVKQTGLEIYTSRSSNFLISLISSRCLSDTSG